MGLQSEGPEQTNGNCKANPNLRVVGLGSRWVKGGWVLGAAAASRLLRFGSFCCFSFSSFVGGDILGPNRLILFPAIGSN